MNGALSFRCQLSPVTPSARRVHVQNHCILDSGYWQNSGCGRRCRRGWNGRRNSWLLPREKGIFSNFAFQKLPGKNGAQLRGNFVEFFSPEHDSFWHRLNQSNVTEWETKEPALKFSGDPCSQWQPDPGLQEHNAAVQKRPESSEDQVKCSDHSWWVSACPRFWGERPKISRGLYFSPKCRQFHLRTAWRNGFLWCCVKSAKKVFQKWGYCWSYSVVRAGTKWWLKFTFWTIFFWQRGVESDAFFRFK